MWIYVGFVEIVNMQKTHKMRNEARTM